MMMSTRKDETSEDRMSRLIETDAFQFEFLSVLAERESWRKEVYRPIYHVHKWWANRLGSIFRGIILGALLPEEGNLREAFYSKHDFRAVSIFDPFMGSGTTVGEAHKLGCVALGRDINPVACESVRVALGPLDRSNLLAAYSDVAATIGKRIRELYTSEDETGQLCEVLYFFWVKQVPCLHCAAAVDLFSSRVIARNAYPDRKPEVQVCCPGCGDIFAAMNGDDHSECRTCGLSFNPHVGAANGTKATCQACGRSFSVAKAARSTGRPPIHRLYAKLLLKADGRKHYLSTNSTDIESYEKCSALLQHELNSGAIRLPQGSLNDGYNTRQAINYNYREWRDFFNARQLLALGWLHEAIASLNDGSSRDALLLLFSGVLEFNNVFASYKGEGTGAVRHMFAHHILKPERTPIEANVWGTPKSSGSFSNLFKTRLLRALDYRDSPFEVNVDRSAKSHFASPPFSGSVSTSWPRELNVDDRGIYLSCGSSDKTGLPDESIDLVITDPPFFDNVHYSELADFFYSWQTLHPRGFINNGSTTRQKEEVQDTEAHKFAAKLGAVLKECRRVLRPNGLLIFTYHHSRPEGWTSLVEAVFGARFSVVNAHPVKAEMSVAAPKSQAKEPIQLDIVLVCRPSEQDSRIPGEMSECAGVAARRAIEKLSRLRAIGLDLSMNDCRITVISQFVASLGPMSSSEAAVGALVSHQSQLEEEARRAFETINASEPSKALVAGSQEQQMTLHY
jgi:putative DNA methylase